MMQTFGNKKSAYGRDRDLREYKCRFCKYEWKQYIGTASSQNASGWANHNSVTSQARCRQCGGFEKS